MCIIYAPRIWTVEGKGGSMLYLLYLAIFAHGGQRRGKHIIHTCTGGSLQVQSLEFEFNDM